LALNQRDQKGQRQQKHRSFASRLHGIRMPPL